MKIFAIALAGALLLAVPAPAPAAQAGGVDDPVGYARQAYGAAPAAAADDAAPFEGYSRDPIFTPRLRALFADDERHAGDAIGRLDFSPFTGTQDDDIADVAVASREVEGAPDRQIVTVRFRNFGVAQTVHLYFERIDGRWHIDDIASPGHGSGADAQPPWTLSLVLKFGS